MAELSEISSELSAAFSADGEGPAARIDAGAAEHIVQGAIDGAFSSAAAAQPARPRARRAAFLLLAALVLTGSAAAMYAVQRAHERSQTRAPAAQPAPAPATLPAPAPATLPPAVFAPAPAPAQLAANEQPSDSLASPKALKGRSDAPAVQDLLERANRLRGEGRYRAAERMYLQVVAQNGAGAAAYSARIAAAGLRLEQLSDPRGALRLYEDALRANPAGPLAPELHEGMAQAYRALGRPDDERRELEALLARGARGPVAERAAERLRVLGGSR